MLTCDSTIFTSSVLGMSDRVTGNSVQVTVSSRHHPHNMAKNKGAARV